MFGRGKCFHVLDRGVSWQRGYCRARKPYTASSYGNAWKGFDFRAGGNMDWSAARVVADDAFKKQIRFESARATLALTVYADQPRVDYAYRREDQGGRYRDGS